MKKKYKGLILKVMILISFFFMFSFIGKNHKRVYATPLTSEKVMQTDIEDLKKENKELGEKYLELNNIFKAIKISIYILVGGSGLSIYKIKRKIDKEVEKRVIEEVEKEVNKKVPIEVSEKVGEETNHIKVMIDDLKKDQRLMKETKILVISPNDKDEYKIKDLLKQFYQTKFIKMECVLNNLNVLNGYSVIFFNNINEGIKDDDMIRVISRNDNHKKVYFYFNKTNHRLDYKENENINFASNNATVCSNLLDLMRYQEDIL